MSDGPTYHGFGAAQVRHRVVNVTLLGVVDAMFPPPVTPTLRTLSQPYRSMMLKNSLPARSYPKMQNANSHEFRFLQPQKNRVTARYHAL